MATHKTFETTHTNIYNNHTQQNILKSHKTFETRTHKSMQVTQKTVEQSHKHKQSHK